jgi:CheY-like chemotaxis protein
VFDLFTQAERTSDRASGGMGQGLALVRSLVELHGGSVGAASEGLGKGSRFTILLPRMHTDPVQAGRRHDAQSRPKPLKILVVDDNVDAAAMLSMLLEAFGHQVFAEHEAQRALARASIELPDVCLLDIGLPDMDGNQLARRLRAQPETSKSMLIAVTGYGQALDRSRSAAAGFDYHLVKPLDTAQLTALLSGVRPA